MDWNDMPWISANSRPPSRSASMLDDMRPAAMSASMRRVTRSTADAARDAQIWVSWGSPTTCPGRPARLAIRAWSGRRGAAALAAWGANAHVLGLEVGGGAGGVTVDVGDDVAEQVLGGV